MNESWESAAKWRAAMADLRPYQMTALDFFACAALEGLVSDQATVLWDCAAQDAWEIAIEMVTRRDAAHARLAELQRTGKAQVGMEGDLPCAQRPEEEPVDPGR